MDRKLLSEAERLGIRIFSTRIIYQLLDDVKESLSILVAPDMVTEVNGEARVLELFSIHLDSKSGGGGGGGGGLKKVEAIGGCKVVSGKIFKNHQVRVLRDGVEIWKSSKLLSLKSLKKEIDQAGKGMECGVSLGWDQLQVGDLIQSISFKEVRKKLFD